MTPDSEPLLLDWGVVFQDFLGWDVFDIPVWRIAAFIAVLVLGLFVKNYVVGRVLAPIGRVFDKTKTDLDDALLEAVRTPLNWLVFLAAVWVSVELLDLPPSVGQVTTLIFQTFGTVFVGWMLFRAIEVLGMALDRFTEHTESEFDDHLAPLVKRVLRIVLVLFAAVAVVQQWGYDVTSLIAGLGIGGLAVALAAQDTLSNWFGSVIVFTDRPFRLGDWIKIGGVEGMVEDVGLRSTKVRTFDETVITVPNKAIAHEPVENYTHRELRRIDAVIGLVYSTNAEQIREIVTRVQAVLLGHPLAAPETASVYFSGFGASSLDISLRVFVRATTYADFMTAQQEIFLEVMRIVEEVGSSFAFPSQSVYFENALTTRAHA